VLSIDVAAEAQGEYQPALQDALRRAGLRDRVDLVVADARTYEVPAEALDAVFLDADFSYEGMKTDLEHWLPAVRRGGSVVVRMVDRDSPVYAHLEGRAAGVARFVSELERDPALTRRPDTPPSLAHFVKT
jgi:predicted O-methyltransferase YrrM